MSIPISSFATNPWNFNVMSDEELEALSIDIKANGVKQNILVRKKGDKYEIVDGEHKVKAMKMLGWKDVPLTMVDVREFTDAEVRSYVRSSLTRGTHKDLIREAEIYLLDYQASGLDMKGYAEKIGVEYSKVSRILKRNNMPLPAKAFIQRNEISNRVLDEVLMARPDYVFPLVQRAVAEKWTVEDAQLAVKSGVTVTGEPVKTATSKERTGDVNKLDMVERAAISHILSSHLSNLAKVMSLLHMRSVPNTGREIESLTAAINRAKNKVDGQRVVYPKSQGEQIRRVNDVTEWLASGIDDERKDKVERVNTKIRELIE